MGDSTGAIPPAISRLRHELGLPPAGRLILYAGRFAADHPIDLVLDAAPAVVDVVRLVHFVLIGDGPTRARLEQEARRRSLDAAVIFAGNVAPGQLAQFATACDLGLHLSQSVGGLVNPFDVSEIHEFIKAGRPIVVASDNADTQCFVQVHNIGLASKLGDDRKANVNGLVRIIASLMADEAARNRRAESTRRLAKSLAATASGGMLDIVRASLKRAASL